MTKNWNKSVKKCILTCTNSKSNPNFGFLMFENPQILLLGVYVNPLRQNIAPPLPSEGWGYYNFN